MCQKQLEQGGKQQAPPLQPPHSPGRAPSCCSQSPQDSKACPSVPITLAVQCPADQSSRSRSASTPVAPLHPWCSTSTTTSPIQQEIASPGSLHSSCPELSALSSAGIFSFFQPLFLPPPPEVLMDKLSNRICLLQDILRLIAEVRTQLERPQRVADWHPRSR